LQRLQRLELLLLLDEVGVEGRGMIALRLEIVDPLRDALESTRNRRGVELRPVRRELLRVVGGKPLRELRILVDDLEVQKVRVRLGRDGRLGEEPLHSHVRAARRDDALRHRRHTRELGLRLENALRLVVRIRIADAAHNRRVRSVQENLSGRFVKRGLPERQDHSCRRHEQRRQQNDPLATPNDLHVVAEGRALGRKAVVHPGSSP
jgi:hypothetical protein